MPPEAHEKEPAGTLLTLAAVGNRRDLGAIRDAEALADAKLVEAASAGDQRAFAGLVDRYGQPILSLCLASTLDREEARDLVQEIFLLAWRNLPGFRGGSSFSTWLFAQARNACIDASRRRAARPSLADRDEARVGLQEGASGGDQATLEAIFVAAARLSAPLREAFLLRDLQGLSYEEIAALQAVPIGTVRSRIASARQTIANEVGG